jgi:hypothetical protein
VSTPGFWLAETGCYMQRMRRTWLLLALIACGDNKTFPVEPDAPGTPDGPTVQPIERAHAGGAPSVVVLADDRVFLAIGPRLVIRDVAGGVVGETEPLRGTIQAVAVVGDRAFVGERLDLDALLHVFDISNPAAPVETKVVNLAQPDGFSVIRDLEPGAAGILYVADQEQGVIELSIANPDDPTVVRTAPQFGVTQLQLVGTRLYHMGQGFIGGMSLGALDTTNALASLGESALGSAASVAIAGRFAISAGPDGIFIHDVTDVANPAERVHVGDFDMGPFARAVATAGTHAWVPANDGLYSIDVTDPNNIVVLTPKDEPTVGVNSAAAAGTRLAVITDRGRLLEFDVTNPDAPGAPTIVDATLCADCVDVSIASETAFVADIVGGIVPARLASLAALGRSPATDVVPGPDGLTFVFEGVTLANARAYVADWLYGLRIYDASNPAALVELGSLDTPGAPANVAVVGDRAYLAESTGGGALRVIDVANPARPVELGAIETSKAMEVEVADGIAYVADESNFGPGGLKIYDVQSAQPALLGTYNTECEFPRDVALLDTLAVVACGFDGFHIVDVSNPALPVRIAVVPAPAVSSAWSVATYAGHAVLGHDRGVIVVSLATPAAPSEITTLPTAFAVRALAVPAPGRIVAAAGIAGVYQWQLD